MDKKEPVYIAYKVWNEQLYSVRYTRLPKKKQAKLLQLDMDVSIKFSDDETVEINDFFGELDLIQRIPIWRTALEKQQIQELPEAAVSINQMIPDKWYYMNTLVDTKIVILTHKFSKFAGSELYEFVDGQLIICNWYNYDNLYVPVTGKKLKQLMVHMIK